MPAEDWVLLHSYYSLQQAEILRNTLTAEGIPCEIVNRIDSIYPVLGAVELYVHRDYVMQANHILDQGKDE
jgi:hypothetical protein